MISVTLDIVFRHPACCCMISDMQTVLYNEVCRLSHLISGHNVFLSIDPSLIYGLDSTVISNTKLTSTISLKLSANLEIDIRFKIS